MEKRGVIEEGRTPREFEPVKVEPTPLKKACNYVPPGLEQHTTQRLADAVTDSKAK